MAYTHDFEIKINGIDIEGEISIDAGAKPRIKYMNSPEMNLEAWTIFNALFTKFVYIAHKCGPIERIEINVKP